jgi:hypothetical protein
VRVGTLVSLALAALGVVLFAVKVNYLGESYEGSWDGVVLVIAWLAIAVAVVLAAVTTVTGVARLKRRL